MRHYIPGLCSPTTLYKEVCSKSPISTKLNLNSKTVGNQNKQLACNLGLCCLKIYPLLLNSRLTLNRVRSLHWERQVRIENVWPPHNNFGVYAQWLVRSPIHYLNYFYPFTPPPTFCWVCTVEPCFLNFSHLEQFASQSDNPFMLKPIWSVMHLWGDKKKERMWEYKSVYQC